MRATIATPEGDRADADVATISAALEAGQFFWLDLTVDPDEGDGAIGILRDVFQFHPLAVEDAEHFGQRPKFDDYDDYGYMVVYGVSGGESGGESALQELHIFVSSAFVVTLHRGACPSLDAVHARMARHRIARADAAPADAAPADVASAVAAAAAANAARLPMIAVYLVVDALTDSFFPVLSSFDDQIDDLETSILAQPTEAQLARIFSLKRRLLTMRKVIGPQRDMFAGVTAGVTALPGMSEEAERYFRDLYDHLIRIGDMVDAYRDLVSGVMDTHLSMVSNRLNVVMKQLAVIATVFLPLSFLTGFFGQNFSWLVNRIGSFATFVGVGIGLEVVAVLLLLGLFKRRGWLGGPTA